MHNQFLVKMLVISSCFGYLEGAVFTPGELSEICRGSIHLSYENAVTSFTNQVESLEKAIMTDNVRIDGCNCYILYTGPYRTGRAYFLTTRGRHRIRPTRIRSIYKHPCAVGEVQNAKQKPWVVLIVILIMITIALSIIGLLKFRAKKRIEYEEAQQEIV